VKLLIGQNHCGCSVFIAEQSMCHMPFSLLVPGEGLLVGNFARALFLVHSECAESSYISSRPFRVNAGPVHAYTQASTAQLMKSKPIVISIPTMCVFLRNLTITA
jgi:hypothetical protein